MPVASKTAPTSERRTVCRYEGARIDCLGSHIEIVLEGRPKQGIVWCLTNAGWVKQQDGAYRKPSTPATILQAQDFLRNFHGDEI